MSENTCPNCLKKIDPNQKFCSAVCYCEFDEGNNICGVKLKKKGDDKN